MRLQRYGWVGAVVSGLLLLAPGQGRAEERDHFELKVGATYDQGDFGTSDTTRTLFLPVPSSIWGNGSISV